MEEAPSSPRSRLKFLCSYGGRILPRPSDGVLRYVGGETRVLSVPRSVSFTELKEKIAGMFSAELLVKYQLMVDALVSVKTDQDLFHMIDEYDRNERRPRSPTVASSPRFRLFLFPYSSAAEPSAPLEQRYVDAINGGLSIPEPAQQQHSRPFFTITSAGNSPTSTNIESLSVAAAAGGVGVGVGVEPCLPLFPNAGSGRMGGGGMHRVRSTPNLGGGVGGGSQTGSPRAYQRPSATFSYGGGSGLRMGVGGGFRQEFGYGSCGCSCGCVGSSSQLMMRKYVCSQPATGGSPLGSLAEVSPPRRGSQGFHLGPPLAAPLRRAVWE